MQSLLLEADVIEELLCTETSEGGSSHSLFQAVAGSENYNVQIKDSTLRRVYQLAAGAGNSEYGSDAIALLCAICNV
jgi:hypothetical protein